jgi:hypothetical protein
VIQEEPLCKVQAVQNNTKAVRLMAMDLSDIDEGARLENFTFKFKTEEETKAFSS